MQTGVAVFLAVSVVYFAAFALPFEYAQKVAGGLAQATTLTGAVATFLVLKSYGVDGAGALAVFAAFSVMSAMAVLAASQCMSRPHECRETMHLHAVIFASGFAMGAAGYLSYVVGVWMGLPMWAIIALAVTCAPLLSTVMHPFLMRAVSTLVERLG